MYKINERVVDVFDGEHGTVVAVGGGVTVNVLFDGRDEPLEMLDDEETLMREKDWEQAGADLRAERRAERLYFGYDC